MKIRIGITTHNRASVLGKAIQSALQQDYPNKEVVVFDDGSTDETPQLKERFPMVKWLRTDKGIGLMMARNLLMQDTDADFFVSLDDDAWFLREDEISLSVAYLLNNARVAAIAYDIIDNNKRKSAVERSAPLLTTFYMGCGHMLRLSAVQECNYYLPAPGSYGMEEKDLCIRLMDQGYEIHFMPGVHVWHEKTPVARNLREQRRSTVLNDLIFSLRRVPTVFLVPVLCAKMVYYIRMSREDQWLDTCMEGIRDFFKSLPAQASSIKPVRTHTYRLYHRTVKSFYQQVNW